MTRLSNRAMLLTAALLVMLAVAGMAGASSVVSLTEFNCIGGGAGCGAGVALDDAHGLALSGDGGRLFAASPADDAVAIVVRNGSTNFVSQLAVGGNDQYKCISETGAGPCLDGHGLLEPMDVSARGNNAYFASRGSNAVGIITRDSNNLKKWRQDISPNHGCVSEPAADGCDGTTDVPVSGLAGVSSVLVDPTGQDVYAGGDGSLAIFRRDSTGELSQKHLDAPCINNGATDGCDLGFIPDTILSMAISPDGRFLYAVAAGGVGPGALLVFSRTPNGSLHQVHNGIPFLCYNDDGSNSCVDVRAMEYPQGVTLDRGGKNLLVAANGSDALAIFSIDSSTGLLTQLPGTAGCITETGPGADNCADGTALTGIHGVAVGKNNKWVFTTSDDGVGLFQRSKQTGVVTQVATPGGCATDSGAGPCVDGNGLAGAWRVVPVAGKAFFITSAIDGSVAGLRR